MLGSQPRVSSSFQMRELFLQSAVVVFEFLDFGFQDFVVLALKLERVDLL